MKYQRIAGEIERIPFCVGLPRPQKIIISCCRSFYVYPKKGQGVIFSNGHHVELTGELVDDFEIQCMQVCADFHIIFQDPDNDDKKQYQKEFFILMKDFDGTLHSRPEPIGFFVENETEAKQWKDQGERFEQRKYEKVILKK